MFKIISNYFLARYSTNQNRTASEFRPQIPPNPSIKINTDETKPPTMSSSITTANLSILSAPLSAPPRSTTFAQIAIDDIPHSPDDDDELERRSKLKITYQNSLSSPLSSSPVKRLCLWQNHIAQTTDDDQPPGSNTKSSASSSSSSACRCRLSCCVSSGE